MPAMSPTMTEGGIAAWKKKEGESFAAGDVLLEIETDKATIDVEAQEDGVLGKIIANNGEKGIPVGKTIALIVEEGDDISNLEVPKEEEAPKPKPTEDAKPKEEKKDAAPSTSTPHPQDGSSKHSSHIHVDGPAFPSIIRLINEAGITDYKKIKGTGVRGMLTKGDVLAFLGKASTPTGTYKTVLTQTSPAPAPSATKKEVKPVDALGLRQMITAGLAELASTRSLPTKGSIPTFNDVVDDYLPTLPKSIPLPSVPVTGTSSRPKMDFLDGLI
ncbi:hypothetical protein FRC17_002935 [Serendipita sp. 399]|nr:hypothetical protein FRC17_002935 [Serendipita sp. 399]